MARDSIGSRKRTRRRLRVRSARRARLELMAVRIALALALASPLFLWAWDRSGPQELTRAEVVETRRWRHVAPGEAPHAHLRATLLVEGVSRVVLDRADGLRRGQRIPVWVRRGRLTGRAYFLDLAQEDELPAEE